MKIERVSFKSEGKNIAGILHLPDEKNPPCVIASHGMLSSKDSEKYIFLGEELSMQGIAMLRFDFRGMGESDGEEEDNTITKKLADLNAAIAFIRTTPGLGKRIGLMGSSLGSFLSLIKASEDRELTALVIWATPLYLDDLRSNKQDKDAPPPPPEAFFQDLPKHKLLPILHWVSCCLVIHGERDELVPLDQALQIFNHMNLPKEIHVIGGADHRLTDPLHRRRAVELTVDWFKKHI